MLAEEMALEMAARWGSRIPIVEIPGAGRTPFLDEPVVFLVAVRTLFTTWSA
jgi:pimeloyl-ACP methyl ester carboxylesterase